MWIRSPLLAGILGLAACAPLPAVPPPPAGPGLAAGPGAEAGSVAGPGAAVGSVGFRVMAAGELAIVAARGDSELAGLAAARMIDGDAATAWASGVYQAATAWAWVELAAPSSLTAVVVKTGPSYPGTGYDVQVSTDGAAWTTVLRGQTNATWGMETKTLPAGTSGRFVRLFWHNDPARSAPRFSSYEIDVIGASTSSPTPTPTPTSTPSGAPTPAPTPTPSAPVGLAWDPLAVTRVSLAGRAAASSGSGAAAVDADLASMWTPTAAPPQWIAVPLAAPAAGTLLAAWHSGAYHYLNAGEAPRDYAIQVSADSTDGRNGTWATALEVRNNPARSRVDTFAAPGARWVRLAIRSRWAIGPNLRDLAIYAVAAPRRVDAWLIMGDSITAQAFDPAKPNAFGGAVERLAPGHRPILVGGGTGGDTAADGRTKLGTALALCPPGSFVGLAYGTNDATRGVPIATFKGQLQQAIDLIKASGRQPMLARTPWSLNGALPGYVRAIDELRQANALPPGPDLYTWFRDHQGELRADHVHPTAQGEASIQRLWGEAVGRAYAR